MCFATNCQSTSNSAEGFKMDFLDWLPQHCGVSIAELLAGMLLGSVALIYGAHQAS